MIIAITGARKGIGRYLAEYYLGLGHTVIGCSRESSDLVADRYMHCLADVTLEKDVNAFAAAVRKNFGKMDALINNAGGASMNHFLFTPSETAIRLMNLNYIGAFLCVRAFTNLLRKSDHARIVNFSTVAVPLHLEGELAYVVSKSAVETFTRILAKEIAPLGITANVVGPAPTRTDLIARIPEEKIARLIDRQAIKRMGEPADIANVVDFFLSPASDFVTGQIVYLGGVMP